MVIQGSRTAAIVIETEFLLLDIMIENSGAYLSSSYVMKTTFADIDNDGKLKPIINVYVNDENIKFLQDLETILKDKDEILFLPAVSGG